MSDLLGQMKEDRLRAITRLANRISRKKRIIEKVKGNEKLHEILRSEISHAEKEIYNIVRFDIDRVSILEQLGFSHMLR